MGNDQVTNSSFDFFIACTDVNAYMAMKYFLKRDDKFMYFRKKIAKELINKSYTYENACVSPENIRKRQLSQILKTVSTNFTKYNKIMSLHKNIDTNNTSAIEQIVIKT